MIIWGLVRSTLPLVTSPKGVPVILRSALRFEESLRFAFLWNALLGKGGGERLDSSDSFGILRMTAVTFLRNLRNDSGNFPSESSE